MRKKFILIVVLLQLLSADFYPQDSLYFYNDGDIIFREKKINIDSLSFLDKNSQFQDSVYLMVSGHALFKEAMSKIDSMKFSNSNTNFVYQALDQNSRFSIFSEALVLTGLNEKLNKIDDGRLNISFEDWIFVGAHNTMKIPQSRKYGYTILAESDSVYNLYGIHNINDLIEYAQSHYYNPNKSKPYMTMINYTDSKNFFNQFVAYHLLDRKIAPGKFIDDYDQTGHQFQGDAKYDMEECIETMRENTIIEVKTDKANGRTNLINWDVDSDSGIKILSLESPNKSVNGYYYELDGILTYDEKFYSNISSKRMRIDFASMFSEILNNELEKGYHCDSYLLPTGYVDNFTSDSGNIVYYPPDSRFESYQGDEFFVGSFGAFSIDVTIETPPIPAGNYEVRVNHSPHMYTPTLQLSFDGNIIDTVDFSIPSTDSLIGYVVPGTEVNDPYGYKNDKIMRNNGYMKAPACYRAVDHVWYKAENARLDSTNLRYIIGTFNFPKTENHQIRFKALNRGQLTLDYMEFIPVECIENEDIY